MVVLVIFFTGIYPEVSRENARAEAARLLPYLTGTHSTGSTVLIAYSDPYKSDRRVQASRCALIMTEAT